MTDDAPERQPWHLDKRVPLALIITILAQTVAAGIWLGSITQRVTSLEEWRLDSKSVAADIATIRANIDAIKDDLKDVKDRLRDGKMDYRKFEYQPYDELYRPRPSE